MHKNGLVIRTIVEKIRKNRLTRGELGRVLGLTPEQLENRLALMERQGYLTMERACDPGPGDKICRCCCLPCRSSGAGMAGYGLTEKGRRLAEAACLRDPPVVTDLSDSER